MLPDIWFDVDVKIIAKPIKYIDNNYETVQLNTLNARLSLLASNIEIKIREKLKGGE